MNAREVGAYIRDQRLKAKLSLHGVSSLAGVSIPYLSQIERGLRKPSADILYAIAKALRISAGTLYVRAGILEDSPVPDVASAILADPSITERQKQALVQIYEAFRDETSRAVAPPVPTGTRTSKASATPRARVRRAGTAGGGAKTQAGNSPHPAPLRPSTITQRKEV